MSDYKIYGHDKIAAHLGVHPETLRRWRRHREGSFIEVGSCSNTGGGFGRAAQTYASSADNLKVIMQTRVSTIRSEVASDRLRLVGSPDTGDLPGSGD